MSARTDVLVAMTSRPSLAGPLLFGPEPHATRSRGRKSKTTARHAACAPGLKSAHLCIEDLRVLLQRQQVTAALERRRQGDLADDGALVGVDDADLAIAAVA